MRFSFYELISSLSLSVLTMVLQSTCLLTDGYLAFPISMKFESNKARLRRIVSPTHSNSTTKTLESFEKKDYCKDKSWRLYKSKCYKVHNTFEYFLSANEICISKGGTLVTIGSQQENSFVESLVNTETRYKEGWIGLTNENNLNEYKWVDKTIMSFSNWVFGQPSNDKGKCVQMIPGGTWSNFDCYGKLQFVCERAKTVPVPDETSRKLIIMTVLPLSCVLLMMLFVAYLCARSNEELKTMAMEDKTIPQHFVDIVANSGTVASEHSEISRAYMEALGKSDENGNKEKDNKTTYKERKTRSSSAPNGKDKMYKQVTFV